jgi:hypothetical protein
VIGVLANSVLNQANAVLPHVVEADLADVILGLRHQQFAGTTPSQHTERRARRTLHSITKRT